MANLFLRIARLHDIHVLLYVIDSAPVFLGLFSYLAGVRQQNIETLNENLEILVDQRTSSLRNALEEARIANESITELARRDILTRLPNRVAFQEVVSDAILRAARRHEQLALMFIDLDRFKVVNDSFGHAAGDAVLKVAAQRLTEVVRKKGHLARLGGDEFALLLEDVSSPRTSAVVAKRLLKALAIPFVEAQLQFPISASIGISCFPTDGADVETILKNADIAMYRAKDAGRNTFRFFSVEMGSGVHANMELCSQLHAAIQRNELVLYYQPKFYLRSKQLAGFEALIRWKHPILGLLGPDRFIPLAEETGLIEPISNWVLTTACRQIKEWQDQGLADVPVAVNIPACRFRQAGMLEHIAGTLREAAVPAHLLEIELTESMVMEDVERSERTIRALAAMGINLAIDDFGTGYSSLGYLKRLPVKHLKIDKSFISGIPDDHDDVAITRAIIRLAESLGRGVIAEGVETSAQYEFLERERCAQAQGFLLGHPSDREGTTHLLERLRVSESTSTAT